MQAKTKEAHSKRRKTPTAAQLRRSIEVRDKLDAFLNLVQTVSLEIGNADDPVLEEWEGSFVSDMQERLKGTPPLQLLAKEETFIVEITDKLTRVLLKAFIEFVKGEDVVNSYEANFVVGMDRIFACRNKLLLSEKQLAMIKRIMASVKRGQTRVLETDDTDNSDEACFASIAEEGFDELTA